MLDIDVSWVNGNYQRILFHSVRTASADRVREMAAPRRHLALVRTIGLRVLAGQGAQIDTTTPWPAASCSASWRRWPTSSGS